MGNSESGPESQTLDGIPVIEIIKHMSVDDFLKLTETNKYFRELNNDYKIWKYFLKRDFNVIGRRNARLIDNANVLRSRYIAIATTVIPTISSKEKGYDPTYICNVMAKLGLYGPTKDKVLDILPCSDDQIWVYNITFDLYFLIDDVINLYDPWIFGKGWTEVHGVMDANGRQFQWKLFKGNITNMRYKNSIDNVIYVNRDDGIRFFLPRTAISV